MGGGSWSHGLSPSKGADEDQPSVVTPRADRGFERRPGGRLGLDWVGRRHLCFREWSGLRRGLELQHVAHPSGVLAVGGMPQAEVAHLWKPRGSTC